MPLTPPTGLSPGKLAVYYIGAGARKHMTSLRYTEASFPTSTALADIEVTAWIDLLAAALSPTSFTATAWAILDPTGVQVYKQTLADPVVGTHAAVAAMLGFVSPTIRFHGPGVPLTLGTAFGQASMTLYTGNSYEILPAVQEMPINTDPALEAIASFLEAGGNVWADIWGQKAMVDPFVDVQYNAHVQRVRGA